MHAPAVGPRELTGTTALKPGYRRWPGAVCKYWAWCRGRGAKPQVDVVDVISDLLDKVQTELDDTRHAESNAAHNFSMLQQSLVVDAAAFSSAEKQEFVALGRQASNVDDSELYAPAAAVYVDFAQRFLDKA